MCFAALPGVARNRHELGFSWKLLFGTLDSISLGTATWYSAWTSALRHSHNSPTFTNAQYRVLLHMYPRFQQACMDAVQLSGIDWAHEFHCPHDYLQSVTDGVVVSTLVTKMRLVKPWAADRHSERVFGSAFRHRVMVPTAALRKQLRAYARLSAAAAGVSEADFKALLNSLQSSRDERESVLAPIVQASLTISRAGQCAPEPWARALLYDLSASSPVCVLLRPSCFGIVRAWLVARRVSPDDLPFFSQRCPTLHSFALYIIRQKPSSPALDEALDLLRCVLRVRFVKACMRDMAEHSRAGRHCSSLSACPLCIYLISNLPLSIVAPHQNPAGVQHVTALHAHCDVCLVPLQMCSVVVHCPQRVRHVQRVP